MQFIEYNKQMSPMNVASGIHLYTYKLDPEDVEDGAIEYHGVKVPIGIIDSELVNKIAEATQQAIDKNLHIDVHIFFGPTESGFYCEMQTARDLVQEELTILLATLRANYDKIQPAD